jgi:hypothetical protein
MKRWQFRLRTLLVMTAAVALIFAILRWQPWLSATEREYLNKAEAFDNADVASEVREAIRRGDRRFVGVYEDGLTVPGVSGPIAPDSVRVIEGTSDAMSGRSQWRFQRAALEYARRYNALLSEQLADSK